MAQATPNRRLSTIVAIDIAGYSARAEADEPRAVADVLNLAERIGSTVRTHGGRIFNTAGDGFMLEFPSVTGALAAAEDLAAHGEPPIRIGIHVDEVSVRPGGDLLGHGVNVAARLQALAPPGGIILSAVARRAVHGPMGERLVACGEARLEKMNETMGIFTLTALGRASRMLGSGPDGLFVGTAMTFVPAVPAYLGEGPARVAEGPLVAVLPFDNLSGDADLLYFSDGMSEEILETVARTTPLRVIGRTSSFQLRGPNKDARRVAHELRASHILDGSVRRHGQRVRISAHFIECASQTTLWSERYDRDLLDVFVLQDEIAAAVANALNRNFAPSGAPRPINLAAYDLYLRARDRRFHDMNTVEVVDAFEQVVSMAPRFAPAWAGLSQACAFRARSEIDDQSYAAVRQRSLEAADTALRLDPTAGLAFVAHSVLRPQAHYGEREALLKSALMTSPKDADTLDAAALFYLGVGRCAEALVCTTEAYRLDPLYPVAANMQAVALRTLGRVEESLALCDNLLDRWPHLGVVLLNGMFAAAFGGAWSRFEAYGARLRDLGVEGAIVEWAFALEALREPSPDRLAAQRDRLHSQLAQSGTVHLPWLVLGYALGLKDEVFELVERASFRHLFEERGAEIARTAPSFIFSHSMNLSMMLDARFARLCGKLGLCDYWIATGRWPDCVETVAPVYDFRSEAAAQVGAAART